MTAKDNDTPLPPRPAETRHAWESLLDVQNADIVFDYHGAFNPNLANVFAHQPRRMMDIGCAGGIMGKTMKERSADCHVIGFELNQAAADFASRHLDRVFCGKFEDFDLQAEGVGHGTIDTVVLADVLEHMYDPWRVMVSLRPFLTADAQIIISIPNARNLALVKGLIDRGEWQYASRGLLDITHIRFFTLHEIRALISQTGYRTERVDFFLDGTLTELYEQNKHGEKINIQSGRLKIDNISPQELAELCAYQFFIRARPAGAAAQPPA